MKMIARLVALIIVIMILPSSVSLADSTQRGMALDTDYQMDKLTVKKIQSVFKNTEYKSMKFFQPHFSENDFKTFSDSLNVYPVVGVQGEKITLFIMENQGGKWGIRMASTTALNKDHLSLFDFTIEEDETSDSRNVYFSFTDDRREDDALTTLTLELRNEGISYFSSLDAPFAGEYTYVNLYFDDDYPEVSVMLDFPGYTDARYSFDVYPLRTISVDAEQFDFSNCPISAYDLLEPAIVTSAKNKVDLYYFPDDTMLPVFSIGADEEIQAFPGKSNADWILIYYRNGFFYAHDEDIEFALHNE